MTGIVTFIACVFSTRSSSLQILRNFPRCHSAIMLLFLSTLERDELELAFWLLGMAVAGNMPAASFLTKIGKMQSAGCRLCSSGENNRTIGRPKVI